MCPILLVPLLERPVVRKARDAAGTRKVLHLLGRGTSFVLKPRCQTYGFSAISVLRVGDSFFMPSRSF